MFLHTKHRYLVRCVCIDPIPLLLGLGNFDTKTWFCVENRVLLLRILSLHLLLLLKKFTLSFQASRLSTTMH